MKKAADAAMDGDDTDDPSKLAGGDRQDRQRAAGMVEDEEDVSPERRSRRSMLYLTSRR